MPIRKNSNKLHKHNKLANKLKAKHRDEILNAHYKLLKKLKD